MTKYQERKAKIQKNAVDDFLMSIAMRQVVANEENISFPKEALPFILLRTGTQEITNMRFLGKTVILY